VTLDDVRTIVDYHYSFPDLASVQSAWQDQEGTVTTMLRQLGVEAPKSQEMIIYMMERRAP